MYLSIIITSFFVGKLFNPLPLTNYAFYVIVTALFIPYFKFWGCLKIVLCLCTISLIQDIPFYLSFYQQWPMIYHAITSGVQSISTHSSTQHTYFPPPIYSFIAQLFAKHPSETISSLQTLMTIQGNGASMIGVMLGGFYLGVINALYALSKAYKKIGVYNRIEF
jgi:hypothetical protein